MILFSDTKRREIVPLKSLKNGRQRQVRVALERLREEYSWSLQRSEVGQELPGCFPGLSGREFLCPPSDLVSLQPGLPGDDQVRQTGGDFSPL